MFNVGRVRVLNDPPCLGGRGDSCLRVGGGGALPAVGPARHFSPRHRCHLTQEPRA
jgi:hypothetical protein